MAGPTTERRDAGLDALRAFAMGLGVVLHALIPFTPEAGPMWPGAGEETSQLAGGVNFLVHLFRMPLFFLIAGFFLAMQIGRKGAGPAARNRAVRLGVPMVLAVVALQPLTRLCWLAASPSAYEATGFGPGRLDLAWPERGLAALASPGFWAGSLQPQFHLWFLYYLLLFTAAACCLGRIIRPGGPPRLPLGIDFGLMALAMASASWFMEGALPGGTAARLPPWHDLAYYLAPFVVGARLWHRGGELASRFAGWRVWLGAGLVLACAAWGLTPSAGAAAAERRGPALALQASAGAALIFGLIGLFLEKCGRGGAKVRYAADASYWLYLVGLPITLLAQAALAETGLGWVGKAGLATAATFAVGLTTYEAWVRYGRLGAVLHGPRRRPAAAKPEEARPLARAA